MSLLPPLIIAATTRWAGWTPSAAMAALEEAHLATAAACGYDNEEDLLAELGIGGGEAPGDAMEPAVHTLLAWLGEDDRQEGLRKTPKRVAKAFRDGTRGDSQNLLSRGGQGDVLCCLGCSSGGCVLGLLFKVSWRSKAMAFTHPLQGLPLGMDPSMVDEYTSQYKLSQEFVKIPSIGKAWIFSSKDEKCINLLNYV